MDRALNQPSFRRPGISLGSIALLLALAPISLKAETIENGFDYFEKAIDQSVDNHSDTQFGSLFRDIVKGQTHTGENMKKKDVKLSDDEKGSLLTLLFLTGLKNDWITQERLDDWDKTLKANRSLLGLLPGVNASSWELYSCFHSLVELKNANRPASSYDCQKLSTSFNPSSSFLTTCKTLSPILRQSVDLSLNGAKEKLLSRKELINNAVERSTSGQIGEQPSCQVVSDVAGTKPLAEFIQYVADPGKGSQGSSGK